MSDKEIGKSLAQRGKSNSFFGGFGGENRDLKHHLCTVALVISSILLTGLRFAFSDHSGLHDRNGKPRRVNRRRSIADFRLSSELRLKDRDRSKSVDTRSVRSAGSLGTSPVAGGARYWRMEEVSGYLQKQSDVFGIWKQRFFRLACFEKTELEEFTCLSEDVRKLEGPQFLLLYWTSNDGSRMSSKDRYNPRGAFLLKKCNIHMNPLNQVFTLTGLINAMNPGNPVPPVRLSAGDMRMAHRWISAITFGTIASLFQSPSSGNIQAHPLPDMCDTLGLAPSRAGNAAYESYFRLYNAYRSIGDAERGHGTLPRRFLLAWENYKVAQTKPITPQNIYELTDCVVTIPKQNPCVVVLERVCDFMILNQYRAHGKMYLRAKTPEMALQWAQSISDRCIIEEEDVIEVTDQVVEEIEKLVMDAEKEEEEEQEQQLTPKKAGNEEKEYTQNIDNDDKESLVDELVIRPTFTRFSAQTFEHKNKESVVDELSPDEILMMSLNTTRKSLDSVVSSESDRFDFYGEEDEEDTENQSYAMNRSFNDDDGFASKKMDLNENYFDFWQSPPSGKLSPVVEEEDRVSQATNSRRSSLNSSTASIRLAPNHPRQSLDSALRTLKQI